MPVVSKPDIRNCDGIDLLHSLPDNSVDLILTDPPYMISKDSGMNKLHERKKAGEELTKTEKKFAKPTNFGKWDEDFTMEKLEAKVVNYARVIFLCYEVFALKNLFSFLPFYLFALSHFGLIWCMAVEG